MSVMARINVGTLFELFSRLASYPAVAGHSDPDLNLGFGWPVVLRMPPWC